jgi:hypothetical protein
MLHITLAVTKRVIEYVSRGKLNARQIAIQGAATELLASLDKASKDHPAIVAINGVFGLCIGDTRAIWSAHQTTPLSSEGFTSLYDLLARRPDQPVKFMWVSE